MSPAAAARAKRKAPSTKGGASHIPRVKWSCPCGFETDWPAARKGHEESCDGKPPLRFPIVCCGKLFDAQVSLAGHGRWCKDGGKGRREATKEEIRERTAEKALDAIPRVACLKCRDAGVVGGAPDLGERGPGAVVTMSFCDCEAGKKATAPPPEPKPVAPALVPAPPAASPIWLPPLAGPEPPLGGHHGPYAATLHALELKLAARRAEVAKLEAAIAALKALEGEAA